MIVRCSERYLNADLKNTNKKLFYGLQIDSSVSKITAENTTTIAKQINTLTAIDTPSVTSFSKEKVVAIEQNKENSRAIDNIIF